MVFIHRELPISNIMSLYQNCILSFVHIALYGTFKDHVIFLTHAIMTFYINYSLIGVFLVLTNLYLILYVYLICFCFLFSDIFCVIYKFNWTFTFYFLCPGTIV